ncbi:MAG: hypothetical protein B5M52_00140 [Helicobacteraceae bacterium 4484_230]|nr:MAG: hypothetical protein B5M52_00140 [Helicobacteraceae bacterium 4484_230]
MAGIGFELRRVLKKDRLFSLAKVYGYSALLSSGPWVISIVAILFVGFVNLATMKMDTSVIQFQIVITYAIALASSMIITGFMQLPFTRFIADEIFAGREDELLPAYYGALLIIWIVGFVFVYPFLLFVFPEQGNLFAIGVLSTFLVLSGVWISNILAASLKYYRSVLIAFALSYGLIIVLSFYFGKNLENMIFIFFLGNALLLAIMMTLITKTYKSSRLISFRFFNSKNFYWSLGFAGFFYNLGVWVDKFVFWYHPLTGYEVIGKLHASIVYDMPIFIAYLSILPGMAIFFFRLEADFAEKYELFFDAIRNGATLKLIYLGLFHILTIGAQLQLGFMSVMALLYYIDRRVIAMWMSLLFFFLNGSLSFVSIYLGPSMFGYGYAVSLLIVFIGSLFVLRRELRELEYETFMLR